MAAATPLSICWDHCLSVFRGKSRMRPNVLITGVQGTGKTTLAHMLSLQLNMQHINLAEEVKKHRLDNGKPEESPEYKLDQAGVCELINRLMGKGGCVCDFHTVDFLPEFLFDLIVVLRSDKNFLYPRLKKRGMVHRTIEQICSKANQARLLLSARESYDEHLVLELVSNEEDHFYKNVTIIAQDLDW